MTRCPSCDALDYEYPHGCNSCGYISHDPPWAGAEDYYAPDDSPIGPWRPDEDDE